MYIEQCVASDLCDRYQLENISENVRGGEAMVDLGLSTCIVKSGLNVDDSGSSFAFLNNRENVTELG